MKGFRIVRTDAEIDCPDIDDALTRAGAELVLLPGAVDEHTLIQEVANADLLLMCYTSISAAVIHAATRLRGIVKYGVGIDAIDVDAAIEAGIPVVNVPDYAEQTVAEGAFMMMLALSRKLLPMNRHMQVQGWLDPSPAWLGSDLAGKCVALVGLGRIGRSVARMAGAGFGARVIAFDPLLDRNEFAKAGVERFDDLHALLAEADIVSIHCVLNEHSQALIGTTEFAAMQRNPLFINVSRGAIVDETAMVNALEAGRISGLGLDVYTQEPLNHEAHPLALLYTRDNVILLPHLTFYTEQAMQRLSVDTLERCRELLAGESVTVRSHDPRLRAQRRGVRFPHS